MRIFGNLVNLKSTNSFRNAYYGQSSRYLFSKITDVFKNEDLSKIDKNRYYVPKSDFEKDTFDYIIVGGGSAGSALMWRLVQDDKHCVAVFDLGSARSKLKSQVPAMLGHAVHTNSLCKHYFTVPQSELKGRSILWPRGIGMGGSSNINGMVHIRGHPEDYKEWERLGAKGWSYDECLPFFKKSETCPHGNATYRGKSGPITLSRRIDGYCSHLTDRFLKSGEEAGYKFSDDFNGPNREGFGYYDLAIENGRRASTAQAYAPIEYVSEFICNGDLKLHTKKRVEKIIFDGDKAIGVEANGKKYYAKREVIISSGALESPVLLMRSGIGNEEELKKNGIKMISNVPGVGKNLQDHLEVYLQAKTNTKTLYELEKSLSQQALAFWYWAMHGEGPLNTSYLDSGAMIKSNDSITNPDIQLHFFPYLVIDHGKKFAKYNSFQIHAGTMRPKSRGTVSLIDNKIVIDPKYFSVKSDYDDMVKCVHVAHNLFSQPSLSEIITEVLSNTTNMSDFIRSSVDTAYHPCGTCKMGDLEKDKDAVLDNSFRVKGVKNLRVIDASAMPTMVSSNLNATVVMMAERGASMILKDNPVDMTSSIYGGSKTVANI